MRTRLRSTTSSSGSNYVYPQAYVQQQPYTGYASGSSYPYTGYYNAYGRKK